MDEVINTVIRNKELEINGFIAMWNEVFKTEFPLLELKEKEKKELNNELIQPVQ